LLSSLSTCLTACASNPRACANAWPIIETASDAPVITPAYRWPVTRSVWHEHARENPVKKPPNIGQTKARHPVHFPIPTFETFLSPSITYRRRQPHPKQPTDP
jgi:hypothetical protein